MSPKPPLLTIAIPTYDRPGNVSKRIRELLPDLVEGVDVIVLDNHSREEAAVEIACNFPADLPVRVFRHQANLGAGANVLRCLEMAGGEWVWILGDDDAVEKGAVGAILKAVHDATPFEGLINFSTGIHTNQRTQIIPSVSDLGAVPLSGSFAANFLFLSASVYRREAFLPLLRIGYMNIYSCCPHMAMILEMLAEGRFHMRIRPEALVAWECPDDTQRWSNLKLLAGVPSLFDIDSLKGSALPIIKTLIKQGRWRPFLEQGICYIYGDLTRPVRYWVSFLCKMLIFGSVDMKVRSLVLLMSLPFASMPPLRRWTAKKLCKSKSVDSQLGMARM